MLTARFDVRRAELDVQGSELSSAIDKQKFRLTLEEAKGRLAQQFAAASAGSPRACAT